MQFIKDQQGNIIRPLHTENSLPISIVVPVEVTSCLQVENMFCKGGLAYLTGAANQDHLSCQIFPDKWFNITHMAILNLSNK
ncbi:hypothetical protein BMS3Bbin14_00975 [bacterium BMS3Bbin14]|nr:hypothetical protein BMS3Bbin14_00975 [bacterium BMS3Bbin14]